MNGEKSSHTGGPQAISRRTGLTWGLAGFGLVSLFVFLRRLSERFDYETPTIDYPQPLLTVVLVVAGGIYLSCAWRHYDKSVSRMLFCWMLIVGLFIRLMMFSTPAIQEDDFYRYLWDGGVTASGYNPYTHTPKACMPLDIESADPELKTAPKELHALAVDSGPVIQRINHPDLRTIYPPVAQAVFVLAYWLGPWNLDVLRGLFLCFDLAVLMLLVLLLKRLKLPLALLIIYWWNPLIAFECINAAHMDLIVLPFVLTAILLADRKRITAACAVLALAVGVKVWPVLLLPLIIRPAIRNRWKLLSALTAFTVPVLIMLVPVYGGVMEAKSGIRAYTSYWEMNDSLYMLIHWVSGSVFPHYSHFVARLIVMGFLAVVVLLAVRRPLVDMRDLCLKALWIIAALFLLGPTQFPWYFLWLLPLLVVNPRRSLLLLTALLPIYYLRPYFRERDLVDFFDNWVVWIEFAPVLIGMIIEGIITRRRPVTPVCRHAQRKNKEGPYTVAVIIPALNEEQAIGNVLNAIPEGIGDIVVVDNGSVDNTAGVASAHGARVITEPELGYGAACLAGIAALKEPDIVVFLDGDFSDDPAEMPDLIDPIIQGKADMVIGSRVLGKAEDGSLTVPQRFGNWLACRLISLFWGVRYTDLGPFRAIRFSDLTLLHMTDHNYGWTVEMQVKAVRNGMQVKEVPVSYRKRIGQSKISGTLRGVIGAGTKIIGTILVAAINSFLSRFLRKRNK